MSRFRSCTMTPLIWLHLLSEPVLSTKTNKHREAYCTLLTSDEFVQGAIVLSRIVRSLANECESERPFVALVHDKMLMSDNGIKLRQQLESEKINIIPVPWIGNVLGNQNFVYPQYRTTYMKLHVWNLTGYDTVLYLDSDLLPLVSLATLFNRKIDVDSIAAAPDISLPDSFNAGVSSS